MTDITPPSAIPKTITYKQYVAAAIVIKSPLSFNYSITWERGKYNGI